MTAKELINNTIKTYIQKDFLTLKKKYIIITIMYTSTP